MAKTPKTTTAPTGQIAPFGLRMLPDLKEKIEQAARDSGRSMNAEIVARLEQSFVGHASLPSGLLNSFYQLIRISSTLDTLHSLRESFLSRKISALEERAALSIEQADEKTIRELDQRIAHYFNSGDVSVEDYEKTLAEKIKLEDSIASMIDSALQQESND